MRASDTTIPASASPWPHRLALATLIAAVPLVFFGGTVTTLHAGLAIDGWLVLDRGHGDHFLWLYPVDKWFRDAGTFVEHTHRLLGSIVGLLAIATVVATWRTDRRRTQRVLSLAALLAVVLQGVIGGLRVLERSEDLAFLHGAIAQAVFATLGASWVAASAGFGAARRARGIHPGQGAEDLRGRSLFAAAVVYAEIVAGAWLRHGGASIALAVHGLLVLVVIAAVARLASGLHLLKDAAPARLRTWLLALLAVQFALGLASFAVVRPLSGAQATAATALGTSIFPTLHVLTGGCLLLACVASVLWVHRLLPAPRAGTSEPSPVEGARGIEVAR
jgi:cytochrome c oxidase assembly protein subunit 15